MKWKRRRGSSPKEGVTKPRDMRLDDMMSGLLSRYRYSYETMTKMTSGYMRDVA